ncbi:MAG: hypothetical protein KBC74_02240 [Candidatus Pacebacteria bacterium]|nr:hypothetical protein [Candidatus Paceibacterota bacterium]
MSRHGPEPLHLREQIRSLDDSFKAKMLAIWEARGLYIGAEVKMMLWTYVIVAQAHDGYVLLRRKGSSESLRPMAAHPSDLSLV